MAKKTYPWTDKVNNTLQVGGIETSVLDNGPGRGTRIAWINTGTGLRYKVVIDRCMDILDAFYNQHSLAWISHGGITAARPDVSRGIEWLWTFPGGLLTTCGLTQVGAPTAELGLHGRASNLQASIESIAQPDVRTGKLDMSITGLIRQSRVFGPSLELRRTISGRLGESFIRIQDEITNAGTEKVPHMLLYHCNFGWPLIDEGADIIYRGTYRSRGFEMDDAVFNTRRNFRKCSKPLDSHRGGGEGCGFIDARTDRKGMVTCGVANRKLRLALKMQYAKKAFPCLANWQHWGIGDYVMALEPGTNFPIGQDAAKKEKSLIYLRPGQSRRYDVRMEILTDRKAVSDFWPAGGQNNQSSFV